MPFDQSLWDDSDPNYAPCLEWSGKDNRYAYWRAPRRYTQAGYTIKRVPLGEGHAKDENALSRASSCREQTRQMLHWWNDDTGPKTEPGTWHWLIARYKSDEFSDYQTVKANTRAGYNYFLDQIDNAIGKWPLAQTDYNALMKVKKAKLERGRSTHHIHGWFNTLRRLARYGVVIEAGHAERIATIMSNMKVSMPRARNVAPTREHIAAVVREADKEGSSIFAVGVLMQYWFGLRAVDVRGQFLDGVWADGLTWEMIDPEFLFFEKVISKTAKSLAEAYHFDLTNTPDIQRRLIDIYTELPEKDRTGPVTVSARTGSPYTHSTWTQTWARLRERAGVPKDIWLMDARAGAATDARNLDLGANQLRNAMQHKSSATTERYIRGRSEDLNTVVALRIGRK